MASTLRDIPKGRISENFTWHEMTRGSDADYFNTLVYAYLYVLTQDILQRARQAACTPIHVNSGWRDPVKNALVGGHPRSYHMRGMAADVHGDLDAIWSALINNDIPFDKICRYDNFIHIGCTTLGRVPRRLTYRERNGSWVDKKHQPYEVTP